MERAAILKINSYLSLP